MEQANFNPTIYTPAEYFALEAQSDERHEYFDGELFTMAGASKAHNAVASNLVVLSLATVRASGCQLFTADVRVAVQEGRHYTYPDLVVSCDPDDQRDEYLVRHPVLLVEITSPGTEGYDHNQKFQQYQQLASLRHYVLISQSRWFVNWFRRSTAGEWVLTQFSGPDAVLEIADLALRWPLADVYAATGVPPLWVGPLPIREDENF